MTVIKAIENKNYLMETLTYSSRRFRIFYFCKKLKNRFAFIVSIIVLFPLIGITAEELEDNYIVNFRMMALPPLQESPGRSKEGQDFNIYNVVYADSGSSRTIPSIPYLTQSRQYRYEGPSPLVFYREISGVEHGRDILAEVDITGEIQNIMILALPRVENAESGFATFVLADGIDVFPLNSFRIINFSSKRIACQVDGNRKVLDAGDEEIIHLAILEPRMVPFRLAFYDIEAKDWLQSSSTSVPFYGNSRVLCLVLPDSSNGRSSTRPMIILDIGPENTD